MRRANAVAEVYDGQIDAALKRLKRELDRSGLFRLLRQQSTLYAYRKPGERRRAKAARARSRVRRLARHRERSERAHEARLGHSL
jgi:ribosomal protein S21